jgi:type IV secretion system protein VirD4
MEPIGRQHPGPLFATSTKSDLYEAIVTDRGVVGPIWALDPDGLVPSARLVRWSPVSGCESTRTAERRAGALIAAGADTSDIRSGEFFRNSAKTVLAGLLHAAALGDKTMADVVKWAGDPGDTTPVQILGRLGTGRADWSDRLARHTGGSEVTTSGVMRTLDLALACFQHNDVLELCSPAAKDAFDFGAFIAKNGTVFALGKDRPGGVGPLITAFAEELLFVAEAEATMRATRRLDPPLMFLLDEAPSIAPLPSLPNLAADGRGRGIVVIYAMQSFSQAEQRWGREGAETLGNATTITCVFGGLKVADDLRELSRLCGTKRVVRHTSSQDIRMAGQSVSATWVEEPILEESQIRTLPDGVALLLWAKLPPILSYLPGSWEGKHARAAASAERAVRVRNDIARSGVE